MSFDLILPRDRTPRYPERCVGFLRPGPDRGVAVRSWSGSGRVLLTALAIFFSKTAKARVPACRSCVWGLRLRRLGLNTLFIALIVAGACAGSRLAPADRPRLIRRLLGAAGAFAAVVPYVAPVVWRPPAFDLTPDGDRVTYEFRDPAYADDFATLNDGRFHR